MAVPLYGHSVSILLLVSAWKAGARIIIDRILNRVKLFVDSV